MISIAITATIRPIVLKQTLSSFYKNCFYDFSLRNNLKNNIHIVINVDPIGDAQYTQNDVIKICKQYSNNITYNFSKKANFASAVIWCWKNCTGKYVFHLEDDWVLNDRIELEKLMYFIDNKIVSAVRLYKRDYPSSKPYKMFDCIYKYKNNLFIAQDSSNQFGLNPVLIDMEFIQQALPLMSHKINPEKQFRAKNDKMKDFVLSHKYGIYGKPGDKALVSDIGLSWRKNKRYQKPIGETFLEWQKT